MCAYQSTEIIPDFRDVGVEADGARVGIEGVSVLVDLVVQDTDRAPESGVLAIAVDGLLVGFIRLGVLLLRHVTTAKQVPALCVGVIGIYRLF